MPFGLVSGGSKPQGEVYQSDVGEALSAQLSEVGAVRPTALRACFSVSTRPNVTWALLHLDVSLGGPQAPEDSARHLSLVTMD